MATPDFDTERWVDNRLGVLAPPDAWIPDQARALAALRNRRPRVSRVWRWTPVVTLTAVLVLLLAPVPAVKGFAHACGEFVRRSLTGGSATHSADARRALFNGTALTSLDGQAFNLSDYRGKVVLVTYWSSRCSRCLSEMLWFQEFEQRYRAIGFAVLAISVDGSEPAALALAPDGRDVNGSLRFGRTRETPANSIPTTVLLDRSGRVAVRHTGYCSKREFETDIQALLDER